MLSARAALELGMTWEIYAAEERSRRLDAASAKADEIYSSELAAAEPSRLLAVRSMT
jgi:hypothetical protein